MSVGEPFVLLGGDGLELEALAARLDLHGMTFVHLRDDHRLDRTELLDQLYGGPSIGDTIASLRLEGGWLAPPRADRKPYRTSGRQIVFIDTPKPLSKRRARRLRGRAAA